MNTVALRALLPAVLFLTLQGSSLAQSTWTGNTSAAWNTASNWNPSGVPGAAASVVVNQSAIGTTVALDASPTLTNWSSNLTATGITATPSGANRTLDISGTLTKSGNQGLLFRSNGTLKLTMTVGTLDFTAGPNSTLTFGNSGNELTSLNITTANVAGPSGSNQLVFLGANNTADYTIGTLTLGSGGNVIIANGIAAGNQRGINVGSLNGTTGVVRGANGGLIAATATLNLTGTSTGSYSGQILDGAVSTRVTKSGSATQTLINVNNSYTGGTVISAGTLVVGASNAIGAASGGVEISGASQATLRFNSLTSVANNITYSNTNAASGVERLTANNTAYTVGTTGNFTSSFAGGEADTTAKILAGTNSQGSTVTLTMKFSDTSAAVNDGMRVSDVFSLSGTATNIFVLQLNITGIASDNFIGWLDGGTWVNAVNGNTGNNAILAQQGYLGSFSAFQTTYGSTLSNYIGAYGVDTTAGSTWAVLNHNSDFAVVPEPSTWLLLAGGLTFVMVMRRRRA